MDKAALMGLNAAGKGLELAVNEGDLFAQLKMYQEIEYYAHQLFGKPETQGIAFIAFCLCKLNEGKIDKNTN